MFNHENLKGKVAVVTGGGGVLCAAFAKTLAAQGCKVAARFNILAKLIINKCAVGKRKENAILIFHCKGNNIFFANKRFTARKHIKMSAERLAFAYNSAHFVKSEV